MRFLAVLDAISGHGHAAVLSGLLGALRELAPQAAVLVASGGLPIPAELVPAGVDVLQLPGLQPHSGLFSELSPRAANLGRTELRKVRVALLRALGKSFRPDVVLVEHYPFGRHAFHKELEAWLLDVRARLPHARFVSSLSVLGGRAPEHRREALVESALRRHFDHVLVHTDPRHETLGDDYPRLWPALGEKVSHTGYVLPRPRAAWPSRDAVRASLGVREGARLVVAHAGAGRDGAALLRLALQAHARLCAQGTPSPVALHVVTGSGLDDGEYAALAALAAGVAGVVVHRHLPGLDAVVAAADAVVSMCGYASAAELCASGTPALLGPRRSDGEQVRRAERLARLGYAEVLRADATPADAADWLRRTLFGAARPAPAAVATDGATVGAAVLLGLAEAAVREAAAGRAPLSVVAASAVGASVVGASVVAVPAVCAEATFVPVSSQERS